MRTRRRQPPHRWDVLSGGEWSLWRHLTPPQVFVGSFALLIALGAVGLRHLPGLYAGEPLGWVDALFTATSAVCVTGLVVQDTATYFTPAGQAFLLLLIQLGGLSIVTFAGLVSVVFGLRLSLRHEELTTGSLSVPTPVSARRLTFDIVRFTLVFEAAGAGLLYLLWRSELGADAVRHAIFHAVSAFCNAGFSTFSDNLVGQRHNPAVLAVLMALIVTGGLGFLTLEDVALRYGTVAGRQRRRLSLHSRLVLTTTALLLVGGWALFAVLEWDGILAGLPGIGDRLVNALFMSVTCRTAGFNTVDYGQARESTLFATNLLMSVGGSPGSTAGGIKTTTFALLGLLAWARYRGDEIAHFAGRSLRRDTLELAVGLSVVSFTVVTVGILALTVTEAGNPEAGGFLGRMFEAVSGFNTVGLSTGVTPRLSVAGRLVVVVLMFLGRVGPLSFAAALAVRRPQPGRFRYAYEDVMVG